MFIACCEYFPVTFRVLWREYNFLLSCFRKKGFIEGVKGKEHVRNSAWVHLRSLFSITSTSQCKHPCRDSSAFISQDRRCISVTFVFLVETSYSWHDSRKINSVCIDTIMRRLNEFSSLCGVEINPHVDCGREWIGEQVFSSSPVVNLSA